jgi:hypothetical protein
MLEDKQFKKYLREMKFLLNLIIGLIILYFAIYALDKSMSVIYLNIALPLFILLSAGWRIYRWKYWIEK